MSCCPPKSADQPQTCSNGDSIREDVKDYYGKTLQHTSDLETGACQMGGPGMPKYVRQALKLVHEEVKDRYYGCGLIIPDDLEGANVLDLGSGAGMDCYVLSNLVGEKGHVTGLDMTDEQLAVANKHIDYHTQKYGYKTANIDFVKGYIEKLAEAGIKNNFYDIIVSNCVVNLSPDKHAVLKEAYNALKEGGELYFSDVYADSVVADHIRKHKVLWGECISGALWWKDLYTIAAEVGFSPPRLVTANTFDIQKDELKAVLGDYKFVSATYRLFKLPKEKSSSGEVIYEGQIPHCEDKLVLDHNYIFKTGDPCCVDSQVMTILRSSRFSGEFTYQTDAKKICTDEQVKDISHDPFAFSEGKGAPSKSAECCAGKKCC